MEDFWSRLTNAEGPDGLIGLNLIIEFAVMARKLCNETFSIKDDLVELEGSPWKSQDSLERVFNRLLFMYKIIDEKFIDDPAGYLALIKNQGPRQVCQYQFRRNDIVWICRTCQKDETCVLCNECYQLSSHKGHEVYFYHSQAGGCCDCGDPDAWEPKGFCTKHGHKVSDPLLNVPEGLRLVGESLLDKIMSNLVEFVVEYVNAYDYEKVFELAEEQTEYSLVLHLDDIHDKTSILHDLLQSPLTRSSTPEAVFQELILNGTLVVHRGHDLETLKGLFDSLLVQGYPVCILSKSTLLRQQLLVGLIKWIYKIAQTSDGLCRLVCNALPIERLRILMESDCKLPKHLAVALHNLYLTLMADQSFKLTVAIAYAQALPVFASHYGSGLSTTETSIFGISVQFLNRASYVAEMISEQGFLVSISQSLVSMLQEAATADKRSSTSSVLEPSHAILTHRRYNPLLGDLKVVFSTTGTSRRFCTTCLGYWLTILKTFQFMNGQVRALTTHVEHESREWMYAFNLYLALGSVFDYLCNWFSQSNSNVQIEVVGVKDIVPESLVISSSLPPTSSASSTDILTLWSVSDVLQSVLAAILDWQNKYTDGFQWTQYMSFPSGHFLLFPAPTVYSFHLFLHRFLSGAIREASKHANLVDILGVFQSLSVNRAQLITLIDCPLSNLSLASSIRVGMWRRNGQSMSDQLLNYADVPFCRVFRDLDLLLVQFFAVKYGTNCLLNHIFHRYNVFSYVISKKTITATEIEYGSMLLGEALLLIILLVTELPLPPHQPAKRSEIVMRREIVHRLVGGPCTYSQLQECLAVVPDHEDVKTEDMDAVIASLAEHREGAGLDPSKLVLKDEMWREYDPAFMHITSGRHQHAYEHRPKCKETQPMAPAPPPSHELFRPLRSFVLSDPLLFFTLRDLFTYHAYERLPQTQVYRSICTEWSFKCSGSEYSRALHLLTLIFHELSLSSTDQTNEHLVSMELSGEAGLLSVEDRRTEFSSFLCNSPDVVVQVQKPVVAASAAAETLEAMPTPNGSDEDGKLGTEDAVISRPSFLTTLLDIFDSYVNAEDSNNKFWLRWTIDQSRLLSENCRAVVDARMQSLLENQRAQDMEARRKRARERAMQAFQKTADAFMSKCGDVDSDSDEDRVGNEDKSSRLGPGGQSAAEETITCIVCRESGKSVCNFGYIGFSQVSRLLCDRPTTLHRQGEASFPSESTMYENIPSDLYLQFCGHAMHLSCFDTYFASEVQKNEQMNNLILDTHKGQFQCPMCRKISNLLVPIFPAMNKALDRDSIDPVVNTSDKSVHEGKRDIAGGVSAESRPLSDVSWIDWIERPSIRPQFIDITSVRPSPATSPVPTSSIVNGSRVVGQALSSFLSRMLPRSTSLPIQSGVSTIVSNTLRDLVAANLVEAAVDESGSEESMELSLGGADGRLTTDVAKLKRQMLRFFRDLLEPRLELKAPLRTKESPYEIIQLMSGAVSAVAFSVSVDIADSLSGHHLNASSGGLDDQRHIGLVVDAVGATLHTFTLANEVDNFLYHALSGSGVAWETIADVTVMTAWTASDATEELWLLGPLLQMPLLDCLIFGLSLTDLSAIGPSQQSSNKTLWAYVRWISVASLVQIVLGEILNRSEENKMEEAMDTKSQSREEADGNSGDSPSPPTSTSYSDSSSFKSGNAEHKAINEFIFQVSKQSAESFGVCQPLSENMLCQITLKWTAFLMATLQILFRLHVINETLTSFETDNDEAMYKIVSVLGIWSATDQALEDGAAANDCSQFNVIRKTIEKWVAATVDQRAILQRSNWHYPRLAKPQLIALPADYTQLHGKMLGLCGFEYPALCLTCGIILDAGGKGECTRHVGLCGGDTGLYFLLQDCTVLLMFREKAAYYPAPFVDMHGEKHRHFRGKPLFIDEKRYEVLRKLWSSHTVAREIIQKRSTSNRVIISGHY